VINREEIVEEWGKGNFAGWFDFAQYIAEMAYNLAIDDAIQACDDLNRYDEDDPSESFIDAIVALKDKEPEK